MGRCSNKASQQLLDMAMEAGWRQRATRTADEAQHHSEPPHVEDNGETRHTHAWSRHGNSAIL